MARENNSIRTLSYKTLFMCSAVCLIFLSACKEEYPFGTTPEISMLNCGPDTIQQFSDSIYFSISYKDGDGDLGENNTNDHNLKVIDKRINVTYEFRIQQLVPNAAIVPITGILNFSIPNTFITGTGIQEEVNYDIFVVDRAGHKSNTLTTKNILILK